jgi:hypothetical protein
MTCHGDGSCDCRKPCCVCKDPNYVLKQTVGDCFCNCHKAFSYLTVISETNTAEDVKFNWSVNT